MKTSKYLVGALAFLMLSVSAMQASAENTLAEDVIYTEGVDMHGADVIADPDSTPATIVGPATNVLVDWSDNIVYHQYPAGAKVRTEVILHEIADGGAVGPAVFTLTAHLKIVKIDAANGNPVDEDPYYDSCVAERVFADGLNDFYSVEVNIDGLLLYGFNWDTRAMGCDEGWYRLIFWLEKDASCPDANPFTDKPIMYNPVDITDGAEGDTAGESGTIYGFVGYDFSVDKTWIDVELLPKENGRGSSGSVHWNP